MRKKRECGLPCVDEEGEESKMNHGTNRKKNAGKLGLRCED